ncbi:hypothetical protein TNCV_4739031 [Trichonephila clavipes]|nr:hypothetical protein TNCV_4739031 [Trichonephila clavipes]
MRSIVLVNNIPSDSKSNKDERGESDTVPSKKRYKHILNETDSKSNSESEEGDTIESESRYSAVWNDGDHR